MHANVCVLCMRAACGCRPVAFENWAFVSFILKVWLSLWPLCHAHTRKARCVNLFISFSETLDKFIEEEKGTRPWSVDLLPDRALVRVAHACAASSRFTRRRCSSTETLLKVLVPRGNICL